MKFPTNYIVYHVVNLNQTILLGTVVMQRIMTTEDFNPKFLNGSELFTHKHKPVKITLYVHTIYNVRSFPLSFKGIRLSLLSPLHQLTQRTSDSGTNDTLQKTLTLRKESQRKPIISFDIISFQFRPPHQSAKADFSGFISLITACIYYTILSNDNS